MTLEETTSAIAHSAAGAKPFGAVIRFDTGQDGVISVDGTGENVVVNNADLDADTTIVLSLVNLEKLLKGDLNPAMAAMTGKLKVRGDMALALKMSSFL